jgi:hypothetical protein
VVPEAIQGVCCEGDSLVGVSTACLPHCPGGVFLMDLELSPEWYNYNMPLPIPAHSSTDKRKPKIFSPSDIHTWYLTNVRREWRQISVTGW